MTAMEEIDVDRLLSELRGSDDRRARFRTAVALVDGDTEFVCEGFVDGLITHARRGSGGFGYDPVFAVDGRTFAEMGEEKHAISHRARALRALAEELRSRK